jgi:hypothetical protein
MNLLNFSEHYPDEASCIAKFKEYRERQGVVCPRCGSTSHYWQASRLQFECKQCHSRQGLRSGTVMHRSHLPFRYWFIAMHLLTSTKKSFSSKEIQRQLGHKRYEPIWEMMHKIRLAMGNRDDEYTLDGELELDDGFFSTETQKEEKQDKLKRGRGSQKKTKVLVMAESTKVTSCKPNEKPRKVRCIKMKVIPDLKAATITPIVEAHVSSTSKIDSDNSTSYVRLNEIVGEHHHEVIDTRDIAIVLPWVHVAISNAKRLISSIFHDIKPAYLQLYLNEFCYKFNRRYFGENCFDRLLIACLKTNTDFRRLNG